MWTVTTLYAGLTVGAIYTLIAVCYNVVYVASGTFNFAQAQFAVVGMFVAYEMSALEVPVVVVLLVTAVLGAVIGVVEELVAIRPIARRGVHGELVTTLGFSVVMGGVLLLIWGPDPQRVPPLVSDRVLTVLGGRWAVDDIVLLAAGLGLAVGLHVWSRRTKAGLASLATAEDRDAATLRGLNVSRIRILSFAAAGALSGMAGVLIVHKTFAAATIGIIITLKAFLALSLGGVGSYVGTIAGGLAVGLVEAFSAQYVGGEYSTIILLVLLLALLLLRPAGLFGGLRERVV